MKGKIIDLDKLNKRIEESTRDIKEEPSEITGEDTREENIKENTGTPDNVIEENIKEKATEEEAESIAEEADEVPRLEDGTIDIEAIAIGKDEKGRYIVSDDLFDKYIKELPAGTGNESKTYRAYNHGKLTQLENNREEASKRGYLGALSSNSSQASRRTFAQSIDYMLSRKAKRAVIEDMELSEDAENMDVIIAAALLQAAKGNVKAMEFLRDTVGEKPSEKVDASVTSMTAEDKEMMENILNRLQGENR